MFRFVKKKYQIKAVVDRSRQSIDENIRYDNVEPIYFNGFEFSHEALSGPKLLEPKFESKLEHKSTPNSKRKLKNIFENYFNFFTQVTEGNVLNFLRSTLIHVKESFTLEENKASIIAAIETQIKAIMSLQQVKKQLKSMPANMTKKIEEIIRNINAVATSPKRMHAYHDGSYVRHLNDAVTEILIQAIKLHPRISLPPLELIDKDEVILPLFWK